MWRLLALGILVVAIQVPTAWYLEDIEGSFRAQDVSCPGVETAYLHVQLRPRDGGFQAVAVNPSDSESYLYLGSPFTIETFAVRWDGRLAPPQTTTAAPERENPEVVVPATGEVVLHNGTLAEGSARVVRWQMEWLCAAQRFG